MATTDATTDLETRKPVRKATGASAAKFIAALLEKADIKVGGNRPWDIRMLDPHVSERVLALGNLGLGEAYMDGHWECDRLDEFFARVLRAHLDEQIDPARLVFHALRARLLNRQTMRRAWQVGEQHYDIGNEFYEAMLDGRMTYTCGYWAGGAKTLAEAQEQKLDMICRKLGLQPGMRLLDIGCGWGSLMRFAAEHYGVSCVGVTISKEQAEFGAARCEGLPVEFRLQDYRMLNERFDRIASVGMFEHVGPKNYRAYMEVAHRCLGDDGLFLLHTIGKNRRNTSPDPWIDKYIFPNGELPTIGQIADASGGLFVTEDLHNFGADYDRTLMAWHENFEAAWPRFASSMGERFYRMWRYYLLSCAGAFRARDIQLWQWVLSKNGVQGGYVRPAPG
ncbi:cyclopropane fatty acyl phospholipid synthase [Paraburkholderia caballeronis]|uniref:cyclopropane fatty acyl phospholipid synthase n=1 Tax=Paraburkholderia caballeronis TaxID=416943 RepID=UPI00106652ED|nr:cyclopropane fatty acyl phospholipid synthase [Paraburkholderia caballeronis]TDV09501.1 cyclopropane-fatty-acyl-phospholipid synthase [Paraburkholderia caballeronis]TDV13772.1 cyclopropane-fatty-acyl-phospholipid synthase [Paraburkholderia caballeronis]TDV22954.1 cyclopropane-fatty-acyl-phospholipid synthase [Paraburkholderia caballeronis]TDV28664.1 cyclopropane-fatty-acyl-phospholipid synthase [Paraburkholderia caballeronis]